MKKHLDLTGKSILLTGGTGSFGNKFTEIVLENYNPKTLRILSRDEFKQYEMQQKFKGHKNLRFFLGDVRDKERLYRAMEGVDIVIHAAALKQVPTLEYNPFEAIKTNIIGAQNLINAAIDLNVPHVLALSTDKAVNPINLYGATKLCAEKLFVAANSYAAEKKTRFSVVRYGNVVGSRGSVIPFFKEKRKTGSVPVTDERMTRFWLTLDEGVDFVLHGLSLMKGGEIFIPKIPSMKIMDLAKAVAPDCKIEIIGIRPGEKLHEVLLTEDEARQTVESESFFVIEPDHPFWGDAKGRPGKKVPVDFRYDSANNTEWVTAEDLRRKIDLNDPVPAGK